MSDLNSTYKLNPIFTGALQALTQQYELGFVATKISHDHKLNIKQITNFENILGFMTLMVPPRRQINKLSVITTMSYFLHVDTLKTLTTLRRQ